MKNEKQEMMEELIYQLEKLKRQTNKCLKKVRLIGLEMEVEQNEYSKIEYAKQLKNKVLNDYMKNDISKIEAVKHFEQINNRMNLND